MNRRFCLLLTDRHRCLFLCLCHTYLPVPILLNYPGAEKTGIPEGHPARPSVVEIRSNLLGILLRYSKPTRSPFRPCPSPRRHQPTRHCHHQNRRLRAHHRRCPVRWSDSNGNRTRDKLVDGIARLLGVLSAFGAGWYTLDVATQGNPGLYLYGATSLTGLTIAFLLIGGGIYAGMILAVRTFAAGLDAAILCLITVGKNLWRRIRRFPS